MIKIKEQQDLLVDISRRLKRKMVVYAVGGTAMMFHGFKDATKDIDLVFMNEKDKLDFKDVAEQIGYSQMNSAEVYGTKTNQPIMLSRGKGNEERFDLFELEVIDFMYSDAMVKRATSTYEFGENLVLKISDPNDILLMKCATDRVKDKDDARDIINNFKVDWDIIAKEASNQIGLGKIRAVWDLTGFVVDLIKIGVEIPKEVRKNLFRLLEEQPNSNNSSSP